MGWFYSTGQQIKLVDSERDPNQLPAPRRQPGRFATARKAARTSLQIVSEFRNKMRIAEELISKLAFSLREIQGLRRRPQSESASMPRLSAGQSQEHNRTPGKSAQVIVVDSTRFHNHHSNVEA